MRYLTKDWYLMSQQYPMPEEIKRKVYAALKAFREAQARRRSPGSWRPAFASTTST